MIAVGSGRPGPVLGASSAPLRGMAVPRRFLAGLLHVAAAAFFTGVLLTRNPRAGRDCGLGDSALGAVGADGPSHWTRPGSLERVGSVQQPPHYRPQKKLMQQSASSRVTARPTVRPPAPKLTWDAISTEHLREPDTRTSGAQRMPEAQGPAAPRSTPTEGADGPETARARSDSAGVGDHVDDVEDAPKLPNDLHHRMLFKTRAHTEEDEKEDAAIFRLAKRNLVQDKYLILAVASNGNLDFTKNWIATLRLTGHTSYLVMCLDELICSSLDPAHSVLVPRHWLQGEIDPNPLLYGTAAYVNLVQSKTLVVIPFLKMGFTVLFSDVDIVWMSRGIIPYLEFMMRDNVFREAIFSIEQTPDAEPSVNTGFWLAKPTPAIIRLFDQTAIIQVKRNVTQQYALNVALKAARLKSSPKIAYLDKVLFPNGWVYFKDRLHAMTGVRPLMVHANYMRGSEIKRQRLREVGAWLLDEPSEQEEKRERAGASAGAADVVGAADGAGAADTVRYEAPRSLRRR